MNITNDLVTEYINHRYQPVNDRLDQLRQLGEQDNVPIILKETETFLNMVLALKRPQKILEVGTAIGYSSLYFVFIDAAKSHYKRFFDAAITICEKNALIVSDNILQRAMTASDKYDTNGKHRTNIKKMREYVDYIVNDRTLDTSLMSIGDGIAVSIYRG